METTSLMIKFAGWFQCRLATDPDPTDEPRGVDGYIHAVAGEPDLDRIIRLQPTAGIVQRSYCPKIGVNVVSVFLGEHKVNNHPLIGGSVELLDNAKFEGRNTILTKPGEEAIFPLQIKIKKDKCVIQRKFNDNLKFPPLNQDDLQEFCKLQAKIITVSPGEIGEATGIFDLENVWKMRKVKLQSDLSKTTNEIEKAAVESRIELMKGKKFQLFSVRMLYSMSLTGRAIFEDPDGCVQEKPTGLGSEYPWTIEFWCGGWDADAQSGYIVGYLQIPIFLSKEKEDQVSDSSTYSSYLSDIINDPLRTRL